MPKAPKCMQANYGARAASRANTVKAHVSPGERPQEIFTPEPILRVLREAWGGIALDPCGHPDAIVCAEQTWTGCQVGTGRFRDDGTEISKWEGPGTVDPWVDRTYWNPPFCDLRKWLEHAALQPGRWCGLFPSRTNRDWVQEFLTPRAIDGICWLRPFAFVGYKSAHPDRMVLAYRGPDLEHVAAVTPTKLGRWSRPLEYL